MRELSGLLGAGLLSPVYHEESEWPSREMARSDLTITKP